MSQAEQPEYNKTVFFKTKSTRLNKTWRLRREDVGILPAGIWSVGRAAAGCSLTAWDRRGHIEKADGSEDMFRSADPGNELV